MVDLDQTLIHTTEQHCPQMSNKVSSSGGRAGVGQLIERRTQACAAWVQASSEGAWILGSVSARAQGALLRKLSATVRRMVSSW